MRKNARQKIEGLVWTGLGFALCFGSLRLGFGTIQSPGTGFTSFLGGGLLGVFGLVLTASSLWEKSPPAEKSKPIFSKGKLKQPLLALLVLFSYPLLLKVFGFIFSTSIFLFCLFKAMDPRKWFSLIVISVCGSVASYLIFQVWLRVSFPKGILGGG
jgi:hypothetical protein